MLDRGKLDIEHPTKRIGTKDGGCECERCGVGGKTKFDGGASIGGIAVNGGDKVDTFGSDGLDYNRFDAGWNIGLGVEFGKILVGLDTQLGFCKVKDGNAPHNANIGITLGYKF
mgnify:FL=1